MKTRLKLIAAFKIWIVIYPSILLFHYLFGQSISALPTYQKSLILTLTLVPWVIFVGVPLVDFIASIFIKDKTN
ncbi:hypothetical protein FA048_03760 [Pedobacter polaris]|uniref:Uncharacterized protein n=1 Tax=Pedobacter polaris TaxID=2571273 RepID=A0A4U1CVN0_9SPHI|nr:hypothetical protein [Pedobacter polaris]TKC12746.1 hypothetical protein FA048_03760 [Pedobacter polaris]